MMLIKKGPFLFERVGALFVLTLFGYGVCGILQGWRTQIGFYKNG